MHLGLPPRLTRISPRSIEVDAHRIGLTWSGSASACAAATPGAPRRAGAITSGGSESCKVAKLQKKAPRALKSLDAELKAPLAITRLALRRRGVAVARGAA